MTPGLSEDLLEVNDARKTAMINNELRRLQMDIVALQETRLPATDSIREKDFTFFWQSKPPEEVREHGVGFAIRNRLLGSIVPPTEGSARIIKLQLHTATGIVSLINAYAPTLTFSTEAKDEFHDDLRLTLRDIPQQEPVFLLGDFNVGVGSDHSSWPSCLGQFGFGKMNERGQRPLEFCCRHDLCITNSLFDTKPQHKVSWRHPRSKYWHQLDLVLTERSNLRSVKLTRSFQSADSDTDHSLVVCRVKFQPRKIHRAKKELLNSLEMEDDRVKKFIESRDEQELEECTKAQLQLVADHFGLRLRSSIINNMNRVHRDSHLKQIIFADDTTFIFSSPDPIALNVTAITELNKVHRWLTAKKLALKGAYYCKIG
ncbi:craniofacial development protein 2-like [Procambarus clarkii]|uniref:craniofacial development protein 2-like n=1 Tax=Procambarus clarkii TaxID=6728 RepID=UPI003742DEE0